MRYFYSVLASLILLPLAHCAAVDHRVWTELLQDYSREGMVDYAGLKARPEKLEAYLREISVLSNSEFEAMSEDAQLALLINLYNAATIKLIVDNYPIASIEDIGWFHAAFRRRFINFLGRKQSLNDIEHKTIRVDYDEPRIHFAVVCAAMSCPRLANQAYTAANLDTLLDQVGFAFLGEAALNRLDHSTQTAYMSSIFKWYGADFERDGGSYFDALRRYWPKADRQRLGSQNYRIRYLDYDWSLNDWRR